MGIKSGLQKLSEYGILLFYTQTTMLWPVPHEKESFMKEMEKNRKDHPKLSFSDKLTESWTLKMFEYAERMQPVVDKYRDALTNNPYFTGFIEPLVLRLYDHATHSRNVRPFRCHPRGTSFMYIVRGKPFYPILTMGSERQLQEVCKKECYVCPTIVYSPLGVGAGLLQLSIFEVSRIVSKINHGVRKIVHGKTTNMTSETGVRDEISTH